MTSDSSSLTWRPLTSDLERAVDSLWIFNDPAHYDALVHRRGWLETVFTPWLAARMRDAVLSL
jgi:hypothetical protein